MEEKSLITSGPYSIVLNWLRNNSAGKWRLDLFPIGHFPGTLLQNEILADTNNSRLCQEIFRKEFKILIDGIYCNFRLNYCSKIYYIEFTLEWQQITAVWQ
jgi:hypothetical protein